MSCRKHGGVNPYGTADNCYCCWLQEMATKRRDLRRQIRKVLSDEAIDKLKINEMDLEQLEALAASIYSIP